MTGSIHPRLADAAYRRQLAAQWTQRSRLRLTSVLSPGLAAELAPVLSRLPMSAQRDPAEDALSWRCAVRLPATADPQYPGCLYQLTRFLDRDLPALASAITGRALAAGAPGWINIHMFGKGSYVDAGRALAPAGGVDYLLGLTAATWPEDWGGHLTWADDLRRADVNAASDIGPAGHATRAIEDEVTAAGEPLGRDALVLFGRGTWRVSLVRRHVEGIAVRGALVPVTPDARPAAPAAQVT